MRIAQIAPLHEAVPPKLYGGTERVVSNLTEALVELGHDVTLFARDCGLRPAGEQQVFAPCLRAMNNALQQCLRLRTPLFHPNQETLSVTSIGQSV